MSTRFNRGTGLLIINVVNSNPNGDPDAESEPRTFDDGRGLISPVSFKRKIRDLIAAKGHVFSEAIDVVRPQQGMDILEDRGRDRKSISAMTPAAFAARFWDGRVFGNTFMEEGDRGKFIATGVVQFGPGTSLAPVDVQRLTLTNKSGVQDGKDRGMAPLAFRVVRHGLYVMPFFVNPSAAAKTGCDALDIELLKFLIPHAYTHTASGIRPQVDILHAWYAEHKSPLGSCPDPLIIAALTPRKKSEDERPSISVSEYHLPSIPPEDIRVRLASFEDLCAKDWSGRHAA